MGHHMKHAALTLLLGVVAGGALGCGADCEFNADCGSGFECVARQCQPATVSCASDTTECTTGDECRSGRCTDGCCAAPCASNNDCDSGESCRSGKCLPAVSGCSSDATCFSPTGRCHVEKATCVACLTAADCGGDGLLACSADNRCVLSEGRCTVPGDCGLGLTCLDSFCKPPPTGCTGDQGCSGETPRCKVDSGECVQCTTDLHCSTDGTSTCNLTTNACEAVLPGCGSDAACAAPVPYCRTQDRTCVQCKSVDHCGPDASCQDNVCVPLGGCSSDAQCDAPFPHCRTADRTCVQCLDVGQCGEGKVCTDNVCLPANGCDLDEDCPIVLPICRTDNRACVACVEDDHCEWDEACNANVCERLPGCSWDEECPSETPVCRDTDRTCVGCVDDDDCAGGEVCEDSVCRCSSDADCGGASPACHPVTGECVECSTAFPCAPGFKCWAEGVCEVIPEQGIPCTEDLDCQEGLLCVGTTPENGRCSAECLVYENPSRCPADTVCSRVGWRDGAPVGACVPDLGLAEGELCSSTQLCRPDLECVPESATVSRCRANCDLASPETCEAPLSCRRVVELDAGNAPRTYGLCYPLNKYLDTCETTEGGGGLSGCQSWQVCARGPERDEATRLANICQLPAPGTSTGIAGCNVDADCRTGHCVRSNPANVNGAFAGHCQQACTSDAQCPTANSRPGACTLTPVDWFDETGTPIKSPVAACVPQCAGELDCRPGDTCVAQLNYEQTAWITRCMPPPSPTGGVGGARCTQDVECRSGTCLQNPGNPTDGICLGACSSNAECAGPEAVCATYGVMMPTPGPDLVPGNADDLSARANICWGSGGNDLDGNGQCSNDADCFSLPYGDKRRVCVERPHPALLETTTVYECMPATGDVRGGGVCVVDADCASGECVGWKSALQGNVERRCLARCMTRSDCAALPAETVCHAQIRRPSVTGFFVETCVPAYCAQAGADCQAIETP